MKNIVNALMLSALITGVAYADVVTERQMAMKSIAQTMKGLSAMAKGDIGFDEKAAKTGLLQIEATAAMLPDLFPKGSNIGETESAPAIWEDRKNFDIVMAKFVSDTKIEAAPSDSSELGDKLGIIGANCKACHQDFRVKK